jgi:hypothetical protein
MDIFANFLLMWGAVNMPCHKLILFLHRVQDKRSQMSLLMETENRDTFPHSCIGEILNVQKIKQILDTKQV